MRDISQAASLGIDTSDMVRVTHPDKQARFGGPADYVMTNVAYAKRGLAARGYEIVGRANGAKAATNRELALEAEVEQLRRQLQDQTPDTADGQGDVGDKDDLQRRLDALGVRYHHNAGPAKLQALLNEATAALNDDTFGDEDDDPE